RAPPHTTPPSRRSARPGRGAGDARRSPRDKDRVAVGVRVLANVVLVVDEERRVRVEGARQGLERDALVEVVEAHERGRVVEASHVEFGPRLLEGQLAPL